ncbi:EcsC family protein [Litchfieldia salsa]|uniref:EcsC protein family protein n=1 Tax=Litchfieldia salsa TaxID=930152 RepID=A0A1H0UW29_9BACI|nr:EcsC family protein [Litchfieldia salsa]SDP70118.1 EcsC protein family protein [Litchfieldia salsa]
MNYEEKIRDDLFHWRRRLTAKSSFINRFSKKVQTKVNDKIPQKFHNILTESIKKMVEATLVGSEYTTKAKEIPPTLEEKDILVRQVLNTYKRTAAVEGAGTGAGGIFLGMADFPLLLSIKMKFLFEVASIYGFDTKKYEERLFILYIFQLAFSSDQHRIDTLKEIEQWDIVKEELVEIDWRVFQQEYRDYIDLIKMLQLVPGFGAIVGAYANYNLLDHLGETAINCYHLRLIKMTS